MCGCRGSRCKKCKKRRRIAVRRVRRHPQQPPLCGQYIVWYQMTSNSKITGALSVHAATGQRHSRDRKRSTQGGPAARECTASRQPCAVAHKHPLRTDYQQRVLLERFKSNYTRGPSPMVRRHDPSQTCETANRLGLSRYLPFRFRVLRICGIVPQPVPSINSPPFQVFYVAPLLPLPNLILINTILGGELNTGCPARTARFSIRPK